MLELLKLLQDGRFHSGEALGAALGVSRSAIWKQLQGLESEFGIDIFKVPGRGYRLASPMILLDSEIIERETAVLGWPVAVLAAIDSTNAEVLRRLDGGRGAPFVVLAERQTAGRGRRGRSWASPFAENLYCSLALRVDGGMRQVEALSLTVGLAVARTLQACGLESAGLKWPNDVLVDGQKIAGVLLELSGDPADVCHVVVGIGVNVNMALDDSGGIDQPWTSMRRCLGAAIDRNLLAGMLLRQLGGYLSRHLQHGFAGLRDEWELLHLWRGRSAALTAGDHVTLGVVLGVDERGAICLNVDGVERAFSGGELSLRLRDDS
ncbi:bifunctional biotin--[acetyl-CoA-carboxylase] ligase/biotin operon repressor BirA [Pseudomonas sp. SP16.1]|uniref:bifunctional biotin--[acetyl-CoA-carboxylase] ligase/biotin operon repressor BirA n=1 Tax=Pseudomonas sp. SP16.1 TaxID=3458854 RepID=UPI004045BB23